MERDYCCGCGHDTEDQLSPQNPVEECLHATEKKRLPKSLRLTSQTNQRNFWTLMLSLRRCFGTKPSKKWKWDLPSKTQAKPTPEPPKLSKRAEMRQSPVNAQLLNTIQELSLGVRRKGRQQHTRDTSAGHIRARRRGTPMRKVHKWETPIREVSDKVDKLFTSKCTMIACARSEEEFPKVAPPFVPEIAFFGRSNAGKSTLLSSLSIRGVNVRVSERPGTTSTLDWFEYKGKGAFEKGTVRLVDLPGYGFAFAFKEVQRQWHGLTEKFFRTRHRVLKRVMLLIDARYGIKELDRQVMATLFECRVPFQVVLNKCDIVSVEDLTRRATKVQSIPSLSPKCMDS